MQHVLLTGATGFLGSHLLEALLQQGYKVTILKRSTSDTWRIKHLLEQVSAFNVDEVAIEEAFKPKKIDVVVHLATLYRKFDNGSEVAPMVEANINFPIELFECSRRNDVKNFINTGTFFECDCSALPVRADAPIKPLNFYARTKVAFDGFLKQYQNDSKIITMRLYSPYGEMDNEKLIPILIKNILNGKKTKLSDGLQKLDFIYVDDIVSAYMKAIGSFSKRSIGHVTYNVGTGKPISVREVVSLLEQIVGHSIQKEWGAESSYDIPLVYADISETQSGLNWKPDFSIYQGLLNTFKYYESEMVHEDK